MENNILRGSFFLFISLLIVSCAKPLTNDVSLKAGTLANGLTYSIYPNSYPKDVLSLRLVVRVGSLMEEEHERGLAHFVEHMLFNGTESFPENSLISFLEGQGMQFGADLNAYTSFDRTVYQLDIQRPDPADNENLETALKIMREWLRYATFDPVEIERERGIVLQEKLLSEGYQQRFTDKILSVFYPDTLYLERLPIGLDSMIKGATREEFLSFYDKWYRPSRSSLVISGDNIDIEELEQLIKTSFEDLENAPQEVVVSAQVIEAKIQQSLTHLTDPYVKDSFTTFSDKEVTGASLLIAQKETGDKAPYLSPLSHENQLKAAMNWLFNRRFNEILAKASPLPYQLVDQSFDLMSSYLISTPSLSNVYSLSLFSGQEKSGILDFFREWERLARYGFTQGEFDLFSSALKSDARMTYENRNKRHSRALAALLVVLSLRESSLFPSPEDQFAAAEKFAATVKLEEINTVLKSALTAEKFTYLYSYNPEANVALAQEDILQAREEASRAELEVYQFEALSNLTGQTFGPTPIREEEHNEALGTYSWTLENGIQVIFKPTTFSPRKVQLSSTALGIVGLESVDQLRRVYFFDSLVNESGWGNLSVAETRQFLSDKNLDLSISYDLRGRYLGGSFDQESAEDFFESLYVLLARPKIDALTLEEHLQRVSEAILEEERDYITPFRRKVKEILYGANPYNVELREIPLSEIKIDENLAFYQKQFTDIQSFPFVFVGDLEVEVLKDLTSRYLAVLPTVLVPARDQDLIPYQEGTQHATVANDPEQRVTVFMAFTHNSIPDLSSDLEESRILMRALELAYTRLLMEQVREALSGVYGISFYLLTQERVNETFKSRAQVSFVTSPEQLREVQDAVVRVLRQGQEQGFSGEIIDYIRKNLTKNYRESYAENGYWLSFLLQDKLYRGASEHKDISQYLSAITSASLQQTSRQLLSLDDLKGAILLPKEKV